MNFVPVDSSQLQSVAYEDDVLAIRFKTGSECHYQNVSSRVYRALMAAPRISQYFETEIKAHPDKYPYAKVDVLPPTPEVSSLATIDKMTPEDIFKPGTMDPILEAIRTEVLHRAEGLDASTEQKRKALSSLAFRVTKSRTFIESQRKSLVASEKRRLQAIDAEGRRIWDILEGIEAEVLTPLTAWKQKEQDRKAAHDAVLLNLQNWAVVPFGATSQQIAIALSNVEAVDTGVLEEYEALGKSHKANALKALNAALETARRQEEQDAEMERLRKQAADQAVRDREEALIRETKARAEREAEAARVALEHMILRQRNRAKDAENRAALEKEQSELRAQEAVEREKARAEREQAEKLAEIAKREKDEQHRETIHEEIIAALSQAAFFSSTDAKTVVQLISNGLIPHVRIDY